MNSATPDLLKTRPMNDRPPSSPNSSAEGSSCSNGYAHDQSLSNEDLTSAVLRETERISKKYGNYRLPSDLERLTLDQTDSVYTSQQRTGTPSVRSGGTRMGSGSANAGAESILDPRTRSGRRFERGRPIRRANSKPRGGYSSTTSILVDPPSVESSPRANNGYRDEDNDNDSHLEYGSSTSSNAEGEDPVLDARENKRTRLKKSADVRQEGVGTLRIVLESSPLSSKKKGGGHSKYGDSRGDLTDEGFDSKSVESLDTAGGRGRGDLTPGPEGVRLLLSADPEDLSYV